MKVENGAGKQGKRDDVSVKKLNVMISQGGGGLRLWYACALPLLASRVFDRSRGAVWGRRAFTCANVAASKIGSVLRSFKHHGTWIGCGVTVW
jgi:hypothetical protein